MASGAVALLVASECAEKLDSEHVLKGTDLSVPKLAAGNEKCFSTRGMVFEDYETVPQRLKPIDFEVFLRHE